MTMKPCLCLLLAISVTAFTWLIMTSPAPAQDTERILSFRSDITIHADSSMTVTETIRVVANGDNIRRGIYRDLPVRYRDAQGKPFLVKLHVKAVTRNGESEPFFIQKMGNDRRIYMGDEDIYITPGEHEYRLTYGIQRMLGFFNDHDELYWNVTGTGWDFTIEEASARITLPRSAGRDGFRLAGYTGVKGSTVQDYTSRVAAPDTVEFRTIGPLAGGENLTIVVGFPKGIVTPPTAADLRRWWVDDHEGEIIGLAGLAVVLVYYTLVWVFFGRDPRRRTSWVKEAPPAGLSPAALRYVMRMGSDYTGFTAALLNLAAKGWIILDVAEDGEYTIRRGTEPHGEPAPDEQPIIDVLFNGRDEIAVDRDNHQIFTEAVDGVKANLASRYYQVYFTQNQWGVAGGLAISILAAILMIAFSHEQIPLMMVMIFTSFAMIMATFVAAMFLAANDQLFALPWTGDTKPKHQQVNIPVMAGIAAGLLLIPAIILGVTVSWLSVPPALGLIITNCVFILLLPAYTPLGRRLMDNVGGFRMWLGSIESGRYTATEGKELSRFEILLPYALALGIQQEWTKRFEEALAETGRADSVNYQPAWYHAPHLGSGEFNIGDLGSSFASDFTSNISSASTAPSSGSSGFSGSSGGGGGGGGGGGW